MSNRICIATHGALGDTIHHYFREGSVFGRLQAYKKSKPAAIFKVLCCSSNSQTPELFKEHPLVSSVLYVGHDNKHLAFAQAKKEQTSKGWRVYGYGGLVSAKYVPPKIYLSEEEEKFARSISKQGRYILVHPFASHVSKQWLKIEHYSTLIDMLIDELGYNVITVGATYDKHLGWGSTNKKEELDYKRPGLFNLINQVNVRVAVWLARKAYGFMGAWSAFHRACALCPAGPLVFCSPRSASTIDRVNKQREPRSKYRKIIISGEIDIEAIKKKVRHHLEK